MKVSNQEGQIIIHLESDFITELVNEFRTAVQNEINAGNTSFTVDFSGTVIIDSMGIGCLVATYNTLKQKGGTLQLSNVPENLKDVFQVMRLDRILPIV
jgi:anti-sigma B factor antagonist